MCDKIDWATITMLGAVLLFILLMAAGSVSIAAWLIKVSK